MNKKLKNDIDLFISEKKVFNRTDEEKVFEKIKILENQKPRKLPSLFPQLMSVIGIGILISIVVGIFVVQSGLIASNKRAQTPSEKNPATKEVSNDENKKSQENITNPDQEKEKNNPLPANEYDFNTIQEGMKVENWTLKQLEKSPEHFKQRSYSATFTGDLTLTGTLVCLDHEEYGYGKGTVVFFPADRSLIPRAIQQQDKNLPLKVIGGGNEEGIFNINPGEKREGESIRIQEVTNVFNPDSIYKIDRVGLFNENDTKGSFTRENAPDKLIRDGETNIKVPDDPNFAVSQFAQSIGGALYGVQGSDVFSVIKDDKVVLSYSPFSYTVSYHYINEFREIILANDPILKGVEGGFDKFIQTGETTEIRLDFQNSKAYFKDESGKFGLR